MPGKAVMLLAVGDGDPIELLEVPDDMQVNQDVAVVQVAAISSVTPPSRSTNETPSRATPKSPAGSTTPRFGN